MLQVVWTDQYSTLLTLDEKRIIDDERMVLDRPHTKDWNLLLHDVKYEDRGRYTCQINTMPIKTKTIELIVLGMSF
jgi:neuronal growth regulator 1